MRLRLNAKKASMARRVILDPTFGTLEEGTFWTGQVMCELMGGPVDLSVDTSPAHWLPSSGEPPNQRQRDAYARFRDAQGTLKDDLEQALFAYYNDVRPFYIDGLRANEIEQDVPALSAPSEIWRLLKSPQILVPRQERTEATVLLLWGATWDGERGIEIVLVDNRIETVRRLGDEPY